MSERSERHVPTVIANGREATEARRARGSTLGGFLLERAVVLIGDGDGAPHPGGGHK